ncbi:MAG: hypothetical protein KF802_01380 [Bdellovibrionaceae bacterium]|nr:hypothetical protein [Pseudobdellovibrionaceae bacterium]MBX3035034.1 hypothetical protein [Pseudobdellovibrionaceae bacterium]
MKWMLLPLSMMMFSGCSLFDRRPEDPRRIVREENMAAAAKAGQGPRKRVLVLPFLDANPARSPEFREKARQAFMMDLNKTGQVLAVDSNELKSDPKKFIANGEYVFKDYAASARNLGVSALLEGKIIDLKVKRSADNIGIIRKLTTSFEAVVRVRLANARGGREVFNTTKTVTIEQDGTRVGERVETDQYIRDNPQVLMVIVKDAFLDFTPQIIGALDKISWEGRIAAFSGDRVYLNVGRQSGVQIGDLLRVTEDGDDVYDPESGGHIGRVPGRMKGTLEVVSYFGTDGAVAVVHSGAGFKENDRVEFYQ